MNIFLHELKAYSRFTFIWTLALVALVILFLSMFPYISQEAEEFKKLLAGFPETLRTVIGLSVENIGSILGYYSYVFLYISLLGAVQAMVLAVSAASKEEREKTADFLMAKPVTRTKIITAKLLAAVTSLVITNVFYLSAAAAAAYAVETKEFSIKIFLLLSLTLFFLQLIFLALGFIVSAAFPSIKSVIPVSLGTVFVFFIIGALASTTEDAALRYITPFKYFDYAYIMQNSAYEYSFVITAIGFIAAAIAAAYYIYSRRDIHTV